MSEPIQLQAKGLLFDMDGVLISSIASVVRSWRKWATLYKVPNAATYVTPHGIPARDIIAQIAPEADAEEGLRLIEQIELEDMEDLQVLPGVRALVESLPPERWAIVTSATRKLLMGRLKAAGLPLPGVIVSADDVTKGKPDPEPYLRGAELIHVPIGECIVVEDAPSGVHAGRAAGARVLAVLGTSDEGDLRAAGANWIASSLEGVLTHAISCGVELRFEALAAAL